MNDPTAPVDRAATTASDRESVRLLEDRLSQAEWKAGQVRKLGTHEQYMEAYFLVDALENQLVRLLQDQRTRAAT